MNAKNTQLLSLVQKHALIQAPKGEEFTLTSGEKSPYYYNVKNLLMRPDGLKCIADIFIERLLTLRPDAIGGMESGAIPLVAAVCARWPEASTIPAPRFFYLRKKPRTHGTGRQVEGLLHTGDKVVLLEDVVFTGGSVLKAAEVVRKEGCTVQEALYVVERERGGMAAFQRENIPHHHLCTHTDVFKNEAHPSSDTNS